MPQPKGITKPAFQEKTCIFIGKTGTFIGDGEKTKKRTHSKSEWVQFHFGISLSVGNLIATDIQLVGKGSVQSAEPIAGTVNEKILKITGMGAFELL